MMLTALFLLAAQTAQTAMAQTAATQSGATQPAAAQTVAASGSVAKPALDPDKMICRLEDVTGSNMSRRVCRPRSEWSRLARRTSNGADVLRSRVGAAGIACTGGQC